MGRRLLLLRGLAPAGPTTIDLDDDGVEADAAPAPAPEQRGAKRGLVDDVAAPPLQWRVLRPGASADAAPPPRRAPAASATAAAPCLAERAARRAAALRHVAMESAERPPLDGAADAERLRGRAAAVLGAALGDAALAPALVDAFVAAQGAAAARRSLLSLAAALRGNGELRAKVLAAGAAGAAELAAQDPREWASAEVRERRRQWQLEALEAARSQSGEAATCPACGGRAVVQCGRAGSGRAARLSKLYAHYRCQEEACGKEVHIQEG